MPELGDIAEKVRSKNAGPFWLTIDIFCGSKDRFAHITEQLDNQAIAKLLATPIADFKRFDIPDLDVVKISVPRPTIQGTRGDRDMHGAQWANLLSEIHIAEMP